MDSLCNELARKFFGVHIKAYTKSSKKRDLWQLSTPTAGYSIWLYLHALSKDTFIRVDGEFVAPKVVDEQRNLDKLRLEAGKAPTEELKKQSKKESLVEELRAFLQEVKRVAPLWKSDLDDGVVLIMAPLWRLVPHQKNWQRELKNKWDELAAGKYDWARLAMHLWPERVIPNVRRTAAWRSLMGLKMSSGLRPMMAEWKAPMRSPYAVSKRGSRAHIERRQGRTKKPS